LWVDWFSGFEMNAPASEGGRYKEKKAA